MPIRLSSASRFAEQAQADLAFLEGEFPEGTPEGDAVRRLHTAARWGLFRLREATGEEILDLEDTARLSEIWQRAGGHDDKGDPDPGEGEDPGGS